MEFRTYYQTMYNLEQNKGVCVCSSFWSKSCFESKHVRWMGASMINCIHFMPCAFVVVVAVCGGWVSVW